MTTPSPLAPADLLAALNWRYATKSFDPNKKIPTETWSALEKALILSPSSFGLQPWKFVVVESQDVRAQIMPSAWGQKQVVEASHLVVIAYQLTVDEAHVDKFLNVQAERYGKPAGAFAGYRQMIVGFLQSHNEEQIRQWAFRQCYIALGNLMTSAALLHVDACPMEGFDPKKVDEILGLPEAGLASCVLCALGYRSETDKYATLPKVRFSEADLIVKK